MVLFLLFDLLAGWYEFPSYVLIKEKNIRRRKKKKSKERTTEMKE